MRVVKGNIPSTVDFVIDELGQVYGAKGKLVKGRGVKNAITRTINYTCKLTQLRKNISLNKFVYTSFNPDVILSKNDTVILKNPNLEYKFSIDNLEVITREKGIEKYVNTSKSFYEKLSKKELKILIKKFENGDKQIDMAKIYNVSTSAIYRAKKKLKPLETSNK